MIILPGKEKQEATDDDPPSGLYPSVNDPPSGSDSSVDLGYVGTSILPPGGFGGGTRSPAGRHKKIVPESSESIEQRPKRRKRIVPESSEAGEKKTPDSKRGQTPKRRRESKKRKARSDAEANQLQRKKEEQLPNESEAFRSNFDFEIPSGTYKEPHEQQRTDQVHSEVSSSDTPPTDSNVSSFSNSLASELRPEPSVDDVPDRFEKRNEPEEIQQQLDGQPPVVERETSFSESISEGYQPVADSESHRSMDRLRAEKEKSSSGLQVELDRSDGGRGRQPAGAGDPDAIEEPKRTEAMIEEGSSFSRSIAAPAHIGAREPREYPVNLPVAKLVDHQFESFVHVNGLYVLTAKDDRLSANEFLTRLGEHFDLVMALDTSKLACPNADEGDQVDKSTGPRKPIGGTPLLPVPDAARQDGPKLYEWESVKLDLAEVFGLDAVMVFAGNNTADLLARLQELSTTNIQTGEQTESFFGYCWPSVIDSVLMGQGEFSVQQVLKAPVICVLLEDSEMDCGWKLISREDLLPRLN